MFKSTIGFFLCIDHVSSNVLNSSVINTAACSIEFFFMIIPGARDTGFASDLSSYVQLVCAHVPYYRLSLA